jgi:hypothetical protein
MRYMLLIYTTTEQQESLSEEEQAAEYEAYNAFSAEVRKREVMRDGNALHLPTSATTVRVRGGNTTTTDGPFAETKEHLGGYYLLDCKDLDEAVELAAMIPAAKYGSVEIRPIVEFEQ